MVLNGRNLRPFVSITTRRAREDIHIVCGLSRIIAVAAIRLCCVHSGRVIGDDTHGCGLRGGGRQRYRYEVTGGNWRLDTGWPVSATWHYWENDPSQSVSLDTNWFYVTADVLRKLKFSRYINARVVRVLLFAQFRSSASSSDRSCLSLV